MAFRKSAHKILVVVANFGANFGDVVINHFVSPIDHLAFTRAKSLIRKVRLKMMLIELEQDG